MSNVFANGLEISGKAVDAKTIAAFPDTCFTPPENPATPPGVPVPYPSFGMASDTENGTGTVFIGGKTVNVKNKSDLSKTSGTEAGCAAKKGLVTSKNTGKGYFNSWSNDVKFDGESVIRNTDLATNNHASPTGNTPPWAHFAGLNYSPSDCPKILADVGLSVHKHGEADDHCNYAGNEGKPGKPYNAAKPTQESDHFPQATCFTTGSRDDPGLQFPKGQYKITEAPCVCLEDSKRLSTEHGRKSEMQRFTTTEWKRKQQADPAWKPTYADAEKADLDAIQWAKSPALEPDAEGNPHPALKCLELEMDKYFRDELGMEPETPVNIPDQEYVPKKMVARQEKFDTAGLQRFSELAVK